MALRRKSLAAVLMVVAGFSAAMAESPSRANLYFDAGAVGGATTAFHSHFALPPIQEYLSPGAWSYDPRKPARFSEPRRRPGEPRLSWQLKENESYFGRVPLNGGTFGLETERRFNADKSIPSSQMLDSTLEKHAKRPFIGLSIEAPYASEER